MTINLKISGQTLTVDAPELAEKSIGKLFCAIDADAEWDGLTMRLIFRSVSKVNLIARQTVVTDRASVEVPAEVIRQGYLYINAVGVADSGAVQLTTGDMEVPLEIKSVTGLSAATGTAVSPTQYDELLSLIGDLSADLGAVEDLASSNESAIGTIGEALAKVPLGTQIVRGASADGASYTATGDELPKVVIGAGSAGSGKGSQIVFIPDAVNTVSEPTLQINGGSIVRIALRASENHGDNDLSPSATVTVPVGALMRGVPYTMTFCGAYWLVDSAIGADLFCASTGEESALMRAVAAKTVELESGGEIAVPVVDPLDVGASHNIGYAAVFRTKGEQIAASQTGRTEIPSVGKVEEMIGTAVTLPEYSAADAGKVLLVNADGTLSWGKIATEVIPEPVLAPRDTWYKGTTAKSTITEIEFIDTYTATGNEDESWDASEAQDGRVMAYVNGTKLTLAGNGYGCVVANADSTQAFGSASVNDYFKSLTSILNIKILDTHSVVKMNRMFSLCTALAALDVNGWDTGSVTDMSYMFYGCSALTTLDAGNWNTSSIISMGGMFYMCKALTALDVSGWDTGSVTSMSSMLSGCAALTTLDVSGLNTGNVRTMARMFYGCTALTALDVSNWDTANITDMSGMFSGCTALTALDVSNWDTANITDMSGMFSGCAALTTLDVSGWDTSSVTAMKSMFSMSSYGSVKAQITALDVSKWDTSSCTDMSFMFYGMNGLTELDVTGWDVSKVTNFDHMAAHGYFILKGVETWKVSSACENMNAMFHCCQNETFDVSDFDTSCVKYFCQTFENCTKLKNIVGLDKWDTSAGLGFDEMFQNCNALVELDLSNFDTANAVDGVTASTNGHTTKTLYNVFNKMYKLKKITLGQYFSFSGDGSTTIESYHAVIPTPSETYITGATGLWYSAAYPEGQTPEEVAQTHSGTRTYYALAADMEEE